MAILLCCLCSAIDFSELTADIKIELPNSDIACSKPDCIYNVNTGGQLFKQSSAKLV